MDKGYYYSGDCPCGRGLISLLPVIIFASHSSSTKGQRRPVAGEVEP